MTSRWARAAAALAGVLTMVASVLVAPPARAATTYIVNGIWAVGTPATLVNGTNHTVRWYISVNDDAPAPGNAPVPNLTVTFVATNGIIAAIPSYCKTSGVTPVSSRSADNRTLTCNVGTVNQGSAVEITMVAQPQGAPGSQVAVTATVGGVNASIPGRPVEHPFGMDTNWATTSNQFVRGSGYWDMIYTWSLLHNRGSVAGPNSITYTLDLSGTGITDATDTSAVACRPFSDGRVNGHPWSGGVHPADQLTNFVSSCTLTRISKTSYQMVVTGINYSPSTFPTSDSGGSALAYSPGVVATGQAVIRVTSAATGGATTLTQTVPTGYTAAVGGATSVDDPANNTVDNVWSSGIYVGEWVYSYTGSTTQSWEDTYRVAAGTVVRQRVEFVPSRLTSVVTRGFLCITIDTAHLVFTDVGSYVDLMTGGAPAGAVYEYDTGPVSGDPNDATSCNGSGWTATRPAALDTVKAVRVSFDWDAASFATRVGLWVNTQVKPTTPIGTEIWSFGAYANSSDPAATASSVVWTYPSRTMSNPPSNAILTPGARYPYSYAGRTILRTVGMTPSISKTAVPAVLNPGDVTTYTLTYAAQGQAAVTPTATNYVIVDRLPAGLTYVPGSASVAPVITTESGRQVLTWTLNGFPVNTNQTLSFQAQVATTTAAGIALVNEATATVDGQSSTGRHTARTTIDGSTQVSKTANQAFIPNPGTGSGSGSWTISVSSADPYSQTFTDTIDILPYNGDNRGTTMTGSYVLSGPVTIAPAGGTVYYTTASRSSLSADPSHASNGSSGSITGNTVGWTTTFRAGATAVRVIGGSLSTGSTFQITVPFTTTGMQSRDRLVNLAESRAQRTQALMRTSGEVSVATFYSVSLKKYVRNPAQANPAAADAWLNADDAAAYPWYQVGAVVPYRVVVLNTGSTTVQNITVTDDLEPAAGGFSIASLGAGLQHVHEYSVTTTTARHGPRVVNTACATAPQPADATAPVQVNCDSAGINLINHPQVSAAKTASPASGTAVVPGATASYQVTFTNSSATPAVVDYTDQLAGVLDDATFNTGSLVGTGGVSGAFDAGTGRVRISGEIPAGQTASVTYTVTVKSTGFGDAVLQNIVRTTGATAPASCVGGDTLCTRHPVLRPATVTMTKQVTDPQGLNPAAAAGWVLRAQTTATTGTATSTPAQTEQTTPGTGSVSWTVTFGALTGRATVVVSETVQPGFVFQSGQCVVTSPSAAPRTVTLVDGAGSVTGVAPGDAVACTIVNRTLPDPAQVRVVKQIVDENGTVVSAGVGWTVGVGLGAGPVTAAPAAATQVTNGTGEAAWTLAYSTPGTVDVTVTETQQPGHRFIGGSCTGAGAPVTLQDSGGVIGGTVPAVAPGMTVTCTFRNQELAALTLVKQVSLGSTPANTWTLTATAPSGALAGPSGVSGSAAVTAVPVTPVAVYQLSETGGPATYQQVGDWSCVDGDGDPVAVTASAVIPPAGAEITCTVVNATAQLVLLKLIDGGTGQAPDWLLTATPEALAGLTAATVTGATAAGSGNTLEVRPGHRYTLTEAPADPDAPMSYRFERLEQLQTDGSWVEVSGDEITAPAAGTTSTYRFVNTPREPLALPVTGGLSTDLFLAIGGVVMLVTLAGAAWARQRRNATT